MSFWDYIFDNEYKQRDDIEALKASVAANASIGDPLRRNIHHLADRFNRQELLLTALISYLKDKNLLDQEEFANHMIRVDLADGVEDGRIGHDKSKEAPKCPFCDRPRNPKRDQCVYCGEEITPEDAKLLEKGPRIEYVRCHKCFRRIRKEHAVRRLRGTYCSGCTTG